MTRDPVSGNRGERNSRELEAVTEDAVERCACALGAAVGAHEAVGKGERAEHERERQNEAACHEVVLSLTARVRVGRTLPASLGRVRRRRSFASRPSMPKARTKAPKSFFDVFACDRTVPEHDASLLRATDREGRQQLDGDTEIRRALCDACDLRRCESPGQSGDVQTAARRHQVEVLLEVAAQDTDDLRVPGTIDRTNPPDVPCVAPVVHEARERRLREAGGMPIGDVFGPVNRGPER